jgi:hypothetical protein
MERPSVGGVASVASPRRGGVRGGLQQTADAWSQGGVRLVAGKCRRNACCGLLCGAAEIRPGVWEFCREARDLLLQTARGVVGGRGVLLVWYAVASWLLQSEHTDERDVRLR